MMLLHLSNCSTTMAEVSNSFDLLDERVRRWVWRQGWTSLKAIQENSIPVVLAANCDVIISASTAGGKTEAAFLPILSTILRRVVSVGYQVLYISPLKALINDQYQRLSDMASGLGIDVTPWHGDVDVNRKKRSIKNPNGIIIITPESLESFFINRNQFLDAAFSSLQYIVIDELHSFIGTERGKQLQSLLSRIEYETHRHIPRIAMSATFSDYNIAKQYLRNDSEIPCVIPPMGDSNHEIRILVKEYVKTKDIDVAPLISKEIFNNLRGSNNLVFTNSRGEAEEYTLQLSEMCEGMGVPNEFRVHHGSISKVERETVEKDLKKGEHPLTAICTSTLELGVDIGKVKSIAQIGTAISVSGLRQRLGRSGRRNEPSILRVFSIESKDEGLLYDLRSSLIQNIAIIELMREHKYEAPIINSYHFSTLIQQILSIIAQFGGFYPKDGWILLCQKGAFNNISPQLFLGLLKSLGDKNVISQLNTGQIVIGKEGEKLLKSPDFYVAFVSPPDIGVINKNNSKRIGMIQRFPKVGQVIILLGKRWIVDNLDDKTSKVYVLPFKSGGDAVFSGAFKETNRIIAEKMRDIYLNDTVYLYLDKYTEAQRHLDEGRSFFRNNIAGTNFMQSGGQCYFMNWAGTKTNRTWALLALYCLNKQCDYDSFYVSNLTEEDIKIIRNMNIPSLFELASLLPREQKTIQKYDYLLSDKLLDIEYSNTYLDVDVLKN